MPYIAADYTDFYRFIMEKIFVLTRGRLAENPAGERLNMSTLMFPWPFL